MKDRDLEQLENDTKTLNLLTTTLNVCVGIFCLIASIALFNLAYEGQSPIVNICGGVINLILLSVCIHQILTRND